MRYIAVLLAALAVTACNNPDKERFARWVGAEKTKCSAQGGTAYSVGYNEGFFICIKETLVFGSFYPDDTGGDHMRKRPKKI